MRIRNARIRHDRASENERHRGQMSVFPGRRSCRDPPCRLATPGLAMPGGGWATARAAGRRSWPRA